MRTLTTIKDPVFSGNKEPGSLDHFFLKFINDERDLPFIYLSLKIIFTLIPSAILLYLNVVPGIWWWLHAALHVVLMASMLGPFTLMLHNTSHRPFFKQKHSWGNGIIPWLIGPFMGQSPFLYYSHHIGMHHSEANMPDDKSSTMPYQRDSFKGFMHYHLRFLFMGIVDLIRYFRGVNKKKGRHFLWLSYRGEIGFMSFLIIMCLIHWKATLFVFIIPVLIIRTMMMVGNWSQHAFIDQDEPEVDYKNSITCINTLYNKQCFNDGYHIGHHANPGMHWTDMPNDFVKNKQKYIDHKAIVFEGLNYDQIWFNLMTKRYKKLAQHFVDLGDQFESQEEVIALLKSRTKKFDLK